MGRQSPTQILCWPVASVSNNGLYWHCLANSPASSPWVSITKKGLMLPDITAHDHISQAFPMAIVSEQAAVAHLLLSWCRYTPCLLNKAWIINEIHFMISCLCLPRGGILALFMYCWINPGNIVQYILCWAIATSCPLFTKVTIAKSGWRHGPGPPTEVTYLGLNQPQFFNDTNSCIFAGLRLAEKQCNCSNPT